MYYEIGKFWFGWEVIMSYELRCTIVEMEVAVWAPGRQSFLRIGLLCEMSSSRPQNTYFSAATLQEGSRGVVPSQSTERVTARVRTRHICQIKEKMMIWLSSGIVKPA